MSISHSELDIAAMTVKQRIELALDLLDSVYADLHMPALSARDLQIVRERIAEADADPSDAVPWEEVKERLLDRPA